MQPSSTGLLSSNANAGVFDIDGNIWNCKIVTIDAQQCMLVKSVSTERPVCINESNTCARLADVFQVGSNHILTTNQGKCLELLDSFNICDIAAEVEISQKSEMNTTGEEHMKCLLKPPAESQKCLIKSQEDNFDINKMKEWKMAVEEDSVTDVTDSILPTENLCNDIVSFDDHPYAKCVKTFSSDGLKTNSTATKLLNIKTPADAAKQVHMANYYHVSLNTTTGTKANCRINNEIDQNNRHEKSTDINGVIDRLGKIKDEMKEVRTGSMKETRCKNCLKVFYDDDLYQVHNATCEITKTLGTLCLLCNQRFPSYYRMLSHKCPVNEKLRTYMCGICDKMLKCKATLVNHMKAHQGKKEHLCKICLKSFLLRHQLVKHSLIHSDARPFQCDDCSFTFKNKYALKRHKLCKHTDGETLPALACSYCGKGFSSPYHLNRHKRIHTGEKTHICPICNFSFGENYIVKYHMRKVHEKKKNWEIGKFSRSQRECQYCAAKFYRKKQLNMHLKHLHNVCFDDKESDYEDIGKGKQKRKYSKRCTNNVDSNLDTDEEDYNSDDLCDDGPELNDDEEFIARKYTKRKSRRKMRRNNSNRHTNNAESKLDTIEDHNNDDLCDDDPDSNCERKECTVGNSSKQQSGNICKKQGSNISETFANQSTFCERTTFRKSMRSNIDTCTKKQYRRKGRSSICPKKEQHLGKTVADPKVNEKFMNRSKAASSLAQLPSINKRYQQSQLMKMSQHLDSPKHKKKIQTKESYTCSKENCALPQNIGSLQMKSFDLKVLYVRLKKLDWSDINGSELTGKSRPKQ